MLTNDNFKVIINLISLIICLACILVCVAQDTTNICGSQITCSDCIQRSECVWCITQNTAAIHCLHKDEINKCENKIVNPKSEIIITSKDPSSIISPSKLNIKIRPNEPQNIKFTFTQPKNFPVDLYFLMDISYTMQEHRDKLASLASEIVLTMKNYTSDVLMGFGSFVDKPISPFAYTENGKLVDLCSKEECSLPYSFQNYLPLTNDTNKFTNKVNSTKPSGNVDFPEGSLEALMQTIVCKDEIGWRDYARRLIILSTDASFHIAGDGKLAGIDKPNDGLCHLKDNLYTHSLEQDYPSVGQIVEKAKENNVIVIFAVTETARNIFQQLTHRIGSSHIGILSAKATIVNIMEKIFDDIANTVKIIHNFGSEFDIQFTSNCKNFEHVNASCPGIKPGDSITFTAELKLTKCLKNYTKSNYKIYPSGLNKHISIDVDYLCQCDCEKTGEKLSPSCSNIGVLQCGICECPSDKRGVSCECDNKNITQNSPLSSNCMKPNSSEICSGAGYCNCGQCVCDQKTEDINKIYGLYCECNDKPCFNNNEESCSKHGSCDCGVCKCIEGWSGQKCDCTNKNNTCIAPNSAEVCSGVRGDCVCGKCECNEINGHTFFGDYCETCLNCPRCSNYRGCVECKMLKQDVYNETQCEQNCSDYKIVPVEDVDKTPEGLNCTFQDKNCIFKYKYDFNVEKNTTTLYLQLEKQECIEAAKFTFWAGVPILSILIAAIIALVLFKLITTLQYRQEYAKFLQEKQLERNELNPLYKSPNSTVVNPLYGTNFN